MANTPSSFYLVVVQTSHDDIPLYCFSHRDLATSYCETLTANPVNSLQKIVQTTASRLHFFPGELKCLTVLELSEGGEPQRALATYWL